LPLPRNLSLANRLISALPARERGLLMAHSDLIELKLDATLDGSEHAYFPVEGFVGLLLPMLAAPDVEVALIGHEGMLHTALAWGLASPGLRPVVQAAGRAIRIPRQAFEQRQAEDARLREVLHRYEQVRQTQLAQQVACVIRHSVEQRLARWLLMARDRAHSSELFLTHELLATMLGVRRESVTQAARGFQNRGLISYSRGYVMLLDNAGLEAAACACHAADLSAYMRLLPHETHAVAAPPASHMP
jgi:hypothetical protein